jgi:hypothetical protein
LNLIVPQHRREVERVLPGGNGGKTTGSSKTTLRVTTWPPASVRVSVPVHVMTPVWMKRGFKKVSVPDIVTVVVAISVYLTPST